jgi:hypothetical protein
MDSIPYARTATPRHDTSARDPGTERGISTSGPHTSRSATGTAEVVKELKELKEVA